MGQQVIEKIVFIFENEVGKNFRSSQGQYTVMDIVDSLYNPESEAWKWIRFRQAMIWEVFQQPWSDEDKTKFSKFIAAYDPGFGPE